MPPAEIFRRRHLPHWDVPGAAYFVTACLEGSIPSQGLVDIEGYRRSRERRPRPAGKSELDWQAEQWKRVFVRTEHWLDLKPAVRHLAQPQLARSVQKSLYFFAGQRYDFLAFVVMPSHFHWVFQPRDHWIESLDTVSDKRTPRERIMHSIKSFTANECNKQLGLRGQFWQQESYDHWVRDADELERIVRYIEQNPVKAGLVASPELWPFGSAHDRHHLGLEMGMALRRSE